MRTAWVGMRNLRRAVREEADVCRVGLSMVEMPVQRLVLILPPEEQPPEILAKLAEFPKMPVGVPVRREVSPAEHRVDQQRPAPQPAPAVQVEVQQPAEEIQDLPRPQRARGRPRRGQ